MSVCCTSVLPEELDRPIAGAVDADLRARHDAEAVLEPDLRAAVEAEEVLGQVAEVALAERTREAVGDAERALALAAGAGVVGSVDQREVGLRRFRSASSRSCSAGAGAACAAAGAPGIAGRAWGRQLRSRR